MPKKKAKMYSPKRNPIVTTGLFTAFVAGMRDSRNARDEMTQRKNINLR